MTMLTEPSIAAPPPTRIRPRLVDQLHDLAAVALPRMYHAAERVFVFTERGERGRLATAGRSQRYSAIALIGLESSRATIAPFDRAERRKIASALLGQVATRGLGDAALIAWAATLTGVPADAAWARIEALIPERSEQPTIELAWALTALSVVPSQKRAPLRDRIAERLMAAQASQGHLFPHHVGGGAVRSHVACFADQVYPIQALSEYSRASGNQNALGAAADCAARICALQGAAGQWWWHYDVRTGAVLEEYPVYAIHQDAMGPMALFALAKAGGPDYGDAVERSVSWLAAAPELEGGGLIDVRNATVWRKVARREPGKTSRYVQAAVSRWAAGRRLSGLNRVFPPRVIDYEDRPYHWGWFLYAWASTHRATA